MPISKRVLTILAGGVSVTLLQFLVLLVTTKVIVPGRDLFGFGSGLIFVAALLQGFWAFVYSAILTFLNSQMLAMIASLMFCVWMSLGTFQSAFEIYRREIYFDRELFIADVFQIIANFVIYPLTAVLIWKLRKRFTNSTS